MRDEKPPKKKGGSKKDTDNNDLLLSESYIPDKNIIEEQGNAVEKDDLKTKTEVVENKSGKEQKSRKTNQRKKPPNVQEKKGTSKQEIITDSEENKINNQIGKNPI